MMNMMPIRRRQCCCHHCRPCICRQSCRLCRFHRRHHLRCRSVVVVVVIIDSIVGITGRPAISPPAKIFGKDLTNT